MVRENMADHTSRTPEFWQDIDRSVSIRVEDASLQPGSDREALVSSLRDLEETARRECRRRDTIQILTSGRRLLGDLSPVGISDGPFSHTME
ncbi:hypothetical protein MKK68_24965 [Methylobacterium sp. E-016]|uniref:hypothetical protein n=1 Tax=Methylobacterium sp. E-016 TaxID=2836556 RepID=UPI001FB888E6|nr:hypothetical protein [Methylobacterium sp. E-016]MCJ2078849.1 hypothetical protein [Methylobacterium sp. E-016]